MAIKSEQRLTERLKAQDPKAMRVLFDRYAGYLTAVCSRYISNREDVKDILQEAFIRIYSGIDSFEYRGEGSLKAWMQRIIVNLALKFLRDNKEIVSYEEDLGKFDIVEDEDLDVEDLPPGVIQEMIRALPVGYRTVFNLYVFEEKSHKEIAGMLGIKENSSASQFHRAKAILAQQIREYRQKTTV